jgi:serine/threonine protein kinase
VTIGGTLGDGISQTRQGVPPAGNADVLSDSVAVEELRISELTAYDASSIPAVEPVKPSDESPALPSRSTTVELTKGSLVGEYEVERKLGEGGMGAVYEGVHPVIGKLVAIMVIGNEISKDTRAIARFRREAKVVAGLSSSHIVDVFRFGELPDGRAYFVMEHLSGESLRDRLSRARLPLDEALDLLDQISKGLEAAHDACIVHRDLKPENVFIVRGSKQPLVKLLDFGLVKVAEHSDDLATTQAGVMFGTPLYCSPEQIRSAATVDRRSDIYALGAMAFEMILGRVPFERSTIVEVIAAHLEAQPPQPSSLWPKIPAALDAVLFAMLAKDPAMRPTLGHFQEVIEKLRKSAFAPVQQRASMTPSLGRSMRQSLLRWVARSHCPRCQAPLPKTRRHLAWAIAGLGFVVATVFSFFVMRDGAVE